MKKSFSWHDLRKEIMVFEDSQILAVNKPAGISVTGEHHGTDLVALADQAGESLYPVHRIDKVTSGLVVFAKSIDSHGPLTRQFNKQTVEKTYLAIVPAGLPPRGTIDLPLSVGRKNHVRVAGPRECIIANPETHSWTIGRSDLLPAKNYPSVTQFSTLWSDGTYSVLAVQPITGRKHQIRVHLAWIGFPILGDPLFDKPARNAKAGHPERTHLHSWRLKINMPWDNDRRRSFEAPPGTDFWSPISRQDALRLGKLLAST